MPYITESEYSNLNGKIVKLETENEKLKTQIGKMLSPGPIMEITGKLNIPGKSFARVATKL